MTFRSSLLRVVVAACCGSFFAAPVSARDLFRMGVSLSGGGLPTTTRSIGTNKLKNVPDFFDESALDALFMDVGGFDPTTQRMSAAIDFRGLPAILSWDPSGGGELSVVIPGVIPPGLLTFSSGTIEQDLDDLSDWFKGELDLATAPQSVMTNLLQAVVAHSPVDPIAGNPNSLMSEMTKTQ